MKRQIFKKLAEIEESEVNECLAMLQKSVPDIYEDLIAAKNKFMNPPIN